MGRLRIMPIRSVAPGDPLRMKVDAKPCFDPKLFLAKVGARKTRTGLRRRQIVFSQGNSADAGMNKTAVTPKRRFLFSSVMTVTLFGSIESILAQRAIAPESSAYSAENRTGNAAKLNDFFQDGLEVYKFGMSPITINSLLPVHFAKESAENWASLPRAGEYKHDEVRYFWIPLSYYLTTTYASLFIKEAGIFPLFSKPSYISKPSQVIFLFKTQQLFRISLRLFSTKDCDNYENIFNGIANFFEVPVSRTGDQRGFKFETDVARLIGTINSRGAIIEIIRPGIAGTDGDRATP
jgi:hypothetical protein